MAASMTIYSNRYRYYRALLAVAFTVPLVTMANENTYEPQAACFLQTTSMIDTYANPPTGGDLDFFTMDSTTVPNIIMIVDTSCSMRWMPDMPSAGGCNWQTATGSFERRLRDSGYDPQANYWWDPPNRDPGPGGVDCAPNDQLHPAAEGRDIEYCNLFGCDLNHPNRDGHTGVTTGAGNADSCNWGFTAGTKFDVHTSYFRANGARGTVAGGAADALTRTQVCDNSNFNAAEQAQCHACLNPTSPTFAGYWARGASHEHTYFSGNFLNFFPPRWVAARRAIKDVAAELGRVRLGVVTFDGGSRGAKWLPNQFHNAANNMWPQCVQLEHAQQNDLARRALRKAVNASLKLSDFSGGTPLSTALFRVGQYYVSNDGDHRYNKWFSGSGWSMESSFYCKNTNPMRTVCDWCQFSAAIILTDGMPTHSSLPSQIRNLQQGSGSAAEEYVGDPLQCNILNCNLDNQNTRLAKTAWWLWNHDLRSEWETPQRLATYAVAFSYPDAMNTLHEATAQGGGFALEANDLGALRDAVLSIFADIISRNSTFTSTRLNNTQAQATQSVLMPRMIPRSTTPWPGELHRFDLLSEFALGLELEGSGGSGMFLVDRGCYDDPDDHTESPDPSKATCGPIVSDAATGEFARRTGANRWNLQEPAESTVAAEPFWEAGERLKNLESENRSIWTVLYDDPDKPEVIEFTEENAVRLAPYFGLTTDMGSQECSLLFTMLGVDQAFQIAVDQGLIDLNDPVIAELIAPHLPLPLPAEIRDQLLQMVAGAECPTQIAAVALIRFIRGRRPNGEGDLGWMLHNIFHSSPTIIEPPTRPDLVLTPFRNPQTMVTLALPQNDQFGDGVEAYSQFWQEHRDRDRVALIGSNGGLLHAFHVSACNYDATSRLTSCNRGNGEELWAFVPPTLLPKVKHLILNRNTQHFYVDGNPWVRNIWADGMGDPTERNFERSADEYRTVAVVGLRRGGNHYFALDVTNAHDPSQMWQAGPADENFLWIFPGIGDVNTLTQGQSWNDTGTMPPPIGPVRVRDTKTGAPEATGYSDTHFGERWIVALPGGYDPLQARGLGFHIVDVYTGKPIWQFTRHYEGVRWTPSVGNVSTPASMDEKNPGDLRRYLRYSFATPPTLTSWGKGMRQDYSNPYFDTLIVPDTGGQVWVARLHDPDPENWAAARLFEEYRDDYADAYHIDRRPFFQPAYLSVMPESGLLRAYLGTGNRHHLRQRGHGECGPDNLPACVRAGCDDVEMEWEVTLGDDGKAEIEWEIEDSTEFEFQHYDIDVITMPWCKASSGTSEVEIDDCPKDAYEHDIEYKCEISAGNFQCWVEKEDIDAEGLEDVPCVSDYASQRFYSLRVFGEGDHMPFDGSLDSAKTFDDARLTNDDGLNNGEIVSVSGTESTVGHESPGWFYEYPIGREHTASPSVTAGRCVVWASLEPPPASCEPGYDGSSSDACGDTLGEQSSYMYFRNYVTGAQNCVDPGSIGLDEHGRIFIGTDPQPPPPPQAITQVSSGGETRTTIFMGEGTADVAESDTLLSEFSTVVIPADVHACRHRGEDCD